MSFLTLPYTCTFTASTSQKSSSQLSYLFPFPPTSTLEVCSQATRQCLSWLSFPLFLSYLAMRSESSPAGKGCFQEEKGSTEHLAMCRGSTTFSLAASWSWPQVPTDTKEQRQGCDTPCTLTQGAKAIPSPVWAAPKSCQNPSIPLRTS